MRIERDQPVITIVNTPPTERSILNGKRSIDVYSGIKIPALGPAVINGVLLGEGYQNVTTLDPRFNSKNGRFEADNSRFSESDFRLLANSDVVLVSSMTRNREVSLRLIEWVKENNPSAVVIAGGPDATFKPDLWLRGEKGADYVVRNEGEKTIVELMNALKHGDSVGNIKGISYKRNGEIIHNERRPLLTEEELSNVALPFFPKNIRDNSDTQVVESKRGCPNKCDFCSVTGLYEGTYRLRSNEAVIELLRAGKPEKNTFFVDDNFAHKSRLKEAKELMQAIIDNKLNNRKYNMQLDTVTINYDPEFIKLARKMGLFVAFLGIESIDPKVLKGMRKAATADQNRKAVKIFDDNDVLVVGMEIIGDKNETRKSIDALRKWNRQSGMSGIQVFAKTPIVGSRFGESTRIFPIADKDTNLIDGQNVLTLPPDGFTCSGLQEEIFDTYHDFFDQHIALKALRPLRHIYKDPKRAMELTIMNFAIRSYARELLAARESSEYFRNFHEYQEQVDKDIATQGRRAFEEHGLTQGIPQEGTIFDASNLK